MDETKIKQKISSLEELIENIIQDSRNHASKFCHLTFHAESEGTGDEDSVTYKINKNLLIGLLEKGLNKSKSKCQNSNAGMA